MPAGGVIPDMIHQHMSIVQDYAYRAHWLIWCRMERDNVKPRTTSPLFDAFSHVARYMAFPG